MEIHNDQLADMIRKSVKEALQKEFDKAPSFEIEEGEKNLLILIPDFVVQLHSQLDMIAKAHKGSKIYLCSYKPLTLNWEESDCVISMDLRDSSVREAIIDRLNLFETICVLNTGIRQLSQIVNGDEDDFVSKVVLLGLLHDRKVLLHFDYNPFGSKSSLAEKAVRMIRSAESMNILISYPGSKKEKSPEQPNLITQKDVDDLWKAGRREMSIGSKCIITPLAKDRIKELNIRILPS